MNLKQLISNILLFCPFIIFTQIKAQDLISYPEYLEGFRLEKKEGFFVLTIDAQKNNLNSENIFALVHRDSIELKKSLKKKFKNIIQIPIQRMVPTSTTHLPAIEMLGSLESVVGFPGTKYISSKAFRTQIEKGLIKEMGAEEMLNVESVIAANPEIIIAYIVGEAPKAYNTIKQAGIPILINNDWLAKHPLGKASWVYFFGALFNKLPEADHLFKEIVLNYNITKELAKKSLLKPTVLSGAMYKDIWYAPGGKSWAATFIKDANAQYIFNSEQTGSDTYALEYVLTKGAKANFWIGPAQFTSYTQLLQASEHYKQLTAFQKKKVYTFAAKKGPTGGVLYYELAPQRPDLVLKDLVAIFHPELLPNYSLTFFSKLDD